MSNPIVKHRRGTTEEWELYKEFVPEEGEITVEFCGNNNTLIKVGDGITQYQHLKPISASEEELQKIIDGYQAADSELAESQETIGAELNELKTSFNNTVIVDGLEYIENKLYLKSGDNTVGTYVEITGGSGGGSGAYIDYNLESNLVDTVMTVGRNSQCLLDFTFTSVKMPGERPTGKFTCDIIVGDITKGTYSLSQGRNTLEISEHLSVGENDVKLRCTDIYGNSMFLQYTIKVVELTITSIFNDSQIYTTDIPFKYTPFGLVEKTVHFVVDGKEVSSVVVTSSGSQLTEYIKAQDHGVHTIDVYSTATIDGVDVVSNHLLYEFICSEEYNITPVISSLYNTSTLKQGELVSIPYVVYDPRSLLCEVTLSVYSITDSELYSEQKLTVDRTKQYWNTRTFPVGEVKFSISYKDVVKEHFITTTENDIKVEAVTNDLQLFLASDNRSNTELNPATWVYEDVSTTFNNFNWKSNGWLTDSRGDTCLRMNGDATATVHFQPFKEELREYGKTIEFEFSVRDVNNRDAVVISCFDGNIGFKATADTAFLSSEGTKVSCNYKEDERVRISFTIERLADKTRFVSTYLDGILSSITQYSEDDNFQQSNPLEITLGSEYCGLDLYSIRVYSTSLTDKQILQNYIADMSDPVSKTELFNNNDIYDEYTSQLSYSKLKEKVPTVTFIGKMPTYKGDKRKNSVRMIFEHPQHPELNFDEILAQIDVQGTSSAGYVRKNWKTKHNEEHTHIEGELPAKVFCLKVDYAEGTGTHNTQNANFVETLYSEKILPQKDEERVRTTITGFPIVIFHLDTDDTNLIKNITINELKNRKDVVFSSKGNFNYDKDSESVFGFTKDYDTECWEFCNNTSDSVKFLDNIPENYASDFEARYHPRLGELEDLEDATVKDQDKINELRSQMISRFKQMHDWVVSTNKSKATGNKLDSDFVDTLGKIYTHDTAEYRIAKFRTEFNQYFDEHYTAVYYVYTFFALMVDQRAKNLFLTYWPDEKGATTGKWYPYFYDNDTSYGINNEGKKVFDYYHEDTDLVDGQNVYNGQDSTLWCNFREAFPTLIRNTYANLRTGALTEDKLINQVITNGSDMWSASVYNEDAEYKYVSLARPDYDPDGDGISNASSTYLYQVTGNGEHHFKYFVANRLKYCDSKWYAGNYFTDQIYLRVYTPKLKEYEEGMTDEQKLEVDRENEVIRNSIEAVPPDADIKITPYSDVYAGVRYKAPSGDDITLNLQQKRATKNKEVVFNAPDETFNDTETYIYGASDISSLGDLSPLYCGYIDVSRATKLTHLQIGNHTSGYQNLNLHTLSVGSNQLLKTIDITNCVNLTAPLDVSNCKNIEEIYAEGSGISSVVLPEAGYVRIMKLPDTIANLTIKNQLYIEDLSFENYSGLKTLCIDNCPTIDSTELLQRCKDEAGNYTVERVRLTDIDWELEDTTFLESLQNVKGIDEKGMNTEHAYLVGKCHIPTLTGDQMRKLTSWYPYLTIVFDTLTFTATYYDESGDTELYSYDVTVNNGTSADTMSIVDPVQLGLIDSKYTIKDSTPQYDFEYGGWSNKPNSKPMNTALENIISNVSRYIAFNATVRSYTVSLYNENVLLDTQIIKYGESAVYEQSESLKKSGTNVPYTFSHWEPSCENIVGDTVCYAQFELKEENIHQFTLDEFIYSLDTFNKKIKLNKYLGIDSVGRIPSYYQYEGVDYAVTSVGGFNGSALTYIVLPDTLEEIQSSAFKECRTLESIIIPETVCTADVLVKEFKIGSDAFRECNQLRNIELPETLKTLHSGTFVNCYSLSELILPESLTLLDIMSIYGCSNIKSITIPKNVTGIAFYAFKDCSSLTVVIFEGTPLNGIDDEAFTNVGRKNGVTFFVPWAEDAVPYAPWDAQNATIVYNYSPLIAN